MANLWRDEPETSRRAGQPTRSPYWLIARPGCRDTEILTISGAGKSSTLLLFGFEEEATEFGRWYTIGSGWRAKPIGLVELLSLLREPCAEVEWVALDPLPEIVAEGAIGLVSLPRQSFVDSLLGRGRSWFEEHYHKEGKPHGGEQALTRAP